MALPFGRVKCVGRRGASLGASEFAPRARRSGGRLPGRRQWRWV